MLAHVDLEAERVAAQWASSEPAWENLLRRKFFDAAATAIDDGANLTGLQLHGLAGSTPRPLLSLMDEVSWSQVLANLFINAFHAMTESPTRSLTIETSTAHGFAVVRITDTGHGIAQKDLEQVWLRHFTKKPAGIRGTGKGLPIVKELVEGYGGRLEVASEVGNGTTFTLLFPAASDNPVLLEAGEGDPKLLAAVFGHSTTSPPSATTELGGEAGPAGSATLHGFAPVLALGGATSMSPSFDFSTWLHHVFESLQWSATSVSDLVGYVTFAIFGLGLGVLAYRALLSVPLARVIALMLGGLVMIGGSSLVVHPRYEVVRLFSDARSYSLNELPSSSIQRRFLYPDPIRETHFVLRDDISFEDLAAWLQKATGFPFEVGFSIGRYRNRAYRVITFGQSDNTGEVDFPPAFQQTLHLHTHLDAHQFDRIFGQEFLPSEGDFTYSSSSRRGGKFYLLSPEFIVRYQGRSANPRDDYQLVSDGIEVRFPKLSQTYMNRSEVLFQMRRAIASGAQNVTLTYPSGDQVFFDRTSGLYRVLDVAYTKAQRWPETDGGGGEGPASTEDRAQESP